MCFGTYAIIPDDQNSTAGPLASSSFHMGRHRKQG